jgi:hypothetical protein
VPKSCLAVQSHPHVVFFSHLHDIAGLPWAWDPSRIPLLIEVDLSMILVSYLFLEQGRIVGAAGIHARQRRVERGKAVQYPMGPSL